MDTEIKEDTNKRETSSSYFKKILFDTGLYITIITFVSYVFTFIYHAGMCNGFGIPLNNININFTNILITSFTFLMVIGITTYVYWLIAKLSDGLNNKFGKFLRTMKFYIPYIGWGIFYLIFTENSDEKYYYLIVFFAYWIFFSFINYRTTTRIEKGKEKAKPPIFKSRISLYVAFYAMVFFVTLGLFYTIGEKNSKNIESFEIINADKEFIILRKYDDNYICTLIDNDSLKTYSKFFIFDNSVISNNRYYIEKKFIGKIKYSGIK